MITLNIGEKYLFLPYNSDSLSCSSAISCAISPTIQLSPVSKSSYKILVLLTDPILSKGPSNFFAKLGIQAAAFSQNTLTLEYPISIAIPQAFFTPTFFRGMYNVFVLKSIVLIICFLLYIKFDLIFLFNINMKDFKRKNFHI